MDTDKRKKAEDRRRKAEGSWQWKYEGIGFGLLGEIGIGGGQAGFWV
jgi:hypothetical protein